MSLKRWSVHALICKSFHGTEAERKSVWLRTRFQQREDQDIFNISDRHTVIQHALDLLNNASPTLSFTIETEKQLLHYFFVYLHPKNRLYFIQNL
jgi:hypothetical protein